jgi:hypothetical protein
LNTIQEASFILSHETEALVSVVQLTDNPDGTGEEQLKYVHDPSSIEALGL